MIFEWLPDMDSNHDWVSQSHLCYHYTIRQESAEGIRCGVRAGGQGRKCPSLIFRFSGKACRSLTKKNLPARCGQAGSCSVVRCLPFGAGATQRVREEHTATITGNLVRAQIVEVEHIVDVNGERVVEAGVAAG